MPSRFRFAGLLLLAGVCVWAGPDDDYIAIYRTLSRAETEQLKGNAREARRSFQEAQDALIALHRTYPSWNEKVVGFRLRYIEEKMTELGSIQPDSNPPGGPAPSRTDPKPVGAVPAPIAPEGEVLDQFNRLNEQISELTRDRKLLEAKLREALSAQPTPVDPREMQNAVEKITALQATNQTLTAQLTQQIAERKNLVDKVVAEEAQQALNEANRQLLSQRSVLANLARERTELDAELKRLREGEMRGLKAENSSLKAQVTELKLDTERGRQIADLTGRLSKLQERLDTADRERADWMADKARLEKQLEEYRSHQTEESTLRIHKLETDLALARADAGRQTARVEDLTAQLAREKGSTGQLLQENQSLAVRVAALTSQLADAQKAEAALAAEKTQRMELEAQLKAAEQRLAVVGPPSGTGANDDGTPADSAAYAAKASQAEVIEAEMNRLRKTVRESHAREAELQTVLKDAENQRLRWVAEKNDLLSRLHQLERERMVKKDGTAMVPQTAYQKLESRVRELEKERQELAQKLADDTARFELEGSIIRDPIPVTPREHAVEFRLHRPL